MSHCAVCGWPLNGPVCEACRTPADAEIDAGVDLANQRLLGEPRPEDYPDLERAFLAWQQRDYTRMVGYCLRSLDVDRPNSVSLPTGIGWAFVQDGAAIYLRIDQQSEELSIESPMVRVSLRQRVPLLRALLELNALVLGAARFCLRGDRVILRFADRVVNLNPPKLVNAIEEISELAEQYADLLSVAFAAEMIGPEAQKKKLPWDSLGTPRRLVHLKGADAHPVPWSGNGQASPAPEPAPPGEVMEVGSEPPFAPQHAHAAFEQAIRAQLEAIDGLSDLLRSGVELARRFPVLHLHPATELLLNRAMVFRAIHEYGEACPAAVSALVQQAQPIIAQLWETPPDFSPRKSRSRAAMRRLSEGLPQPGLLRGVINDILATRGELGEQPPIDVPPLPGVEAAKAHLRRFCSEAEHAPTEPDLQHYLLLGGLAELLVRAPLSAELREQVSEGYAESRRRGPTPEAIDLLANALERVTT